MTGRDVVARSGRGGAGDVSVVVVSWNTRELSLRCLDALKASLGGLPATVVVVDNSSVDGSADAVAERHPDVVLIRSDRNRGFAGGVNLALTRITTEYVVLLNPDAEPRPGAVQHLLSHLAGDPGVAVVGGSQRTPDGRFVPTGHRFPSLVHDLATAPGIYQVGRALLRSGGAPAAVFFATSTRDVDWLSGAFIAFRRSVVDEVGPLPEEFFLYGEDIEWCWRLKRGGWRVRYVGGPGIVHEGGSSSDLLPDNEGALRVLDALHAFARSHRNPIAWRAGWLARWAILRTRMSLRRSPLAGLARPRAASETALLGACARRCREQLTGRQPVAAGTDPTAPASPSGGG